MRSRLTPSLLFMLAVPFAGCSNDTTSDPKSTFDQPAYAIQSMVFGTDGSTGTTSYISLLPSLETQADLKLSAAQEFPGYTPADPSDGALFVGSGEAPTFTRYDVDDAGGWINEGTISFAKYTSLPMVGSVYVTPTKSYAPVNTTGHVIWDPEAIAITGEIAGPAEIPQVRDGGLLVQRSYGNEVRDGKVFQPYYFSSADFHSYVGISQISVIDSATDQVTGVLDVGCPHFHVSSHDDAGNLYFSNGQGSISAAVLVADQPKNCFARIKRGETTVDPTFTTFFKDLTGDREGSNFYYLNDQIALINVYHAERDNITAATTQADVDYSPNYHLWTVDLRTMQAQPLAGLDFGGGQFAAFRIDDRTFLAIPAADYASTAVYEVLASGTAEKRFETEGWTFKMFRVR